MKRARKHRKRHILPGPAGKVDFTTTTTTSTTGNKSANGNNRNNNINVKYTDDNVNDDVKGISSLSSKHSNANAISSSTQCQSQCQPQQQSQQSQCQSLHTQIWDVMCLSLNRILPPLPITPSSMSLSYNTNNYDYYLHWLRQVLSPEYTLLSDLLLSNDETLVIPKIVIQFHNIYSHNGHCDYTADLLDESILYLTSIISSKDETTNRNLQHHNTYHCQNNNIHNNYTIMAWLSHSLIQNYPQWVKPGVVLLCQNVSIAFFNTNDYTDDTTDNDFHNNTTANNNPNMDIEKMLLIGEENVIYAWGLDSISIDDKSNNTSNNSRNDNTSTSIGRMTHLQYIKLIEKRTEIETKLLMSMSSIDKKHCNDDNSHANDEDNDSVNSIGEDEEVEEKKEDGTSDTTTCTIEVTTSTNHITLSKNNNIFADLFARNNNENDHDADESNNISNPSSSLLPSLFVQPSSSQSTKNNKHSLQNTNIHVSSSDTYRNDMNNINNINNIDSNRNNDDCSKDNNSSFDVHQTPNATTTTMNANVVSTTQQGKRSFQHIITNPYSSISSSKRNQYNIDSNKTIISTTPKWSTPVVNRHNTPQGTISNPATPQPQQSQSQPRPLPELQSLTQTLRQETQPTTKTNSCINTINTTNNTIIAQTNNDGENSNCTLQNKCKIFNTNNGDNRMTQQQKSCTSLWSNLISGAYNNTAAAIDEDDGDDAFDDDDEEEEYEVTLPISTSYDDDNSNTISSTMSITPPVTVDKYDENDQISSTLNTMPIFGSIAETDMDAFDEEE